MATKSLDLIKSEVPDVLVTVISHDRLGLMYHDWLTRARPGARWDLLSAFHHGLCRHDLRTDLSAMPQQARTRLSVAAMGPAGGCRRRRSMIPLRRPYRFQLIFVPADRRLYLSDLTGYLYCLPLRFLAGCVLVLSPITAINIARDQDGSY